MYGVSCGSIQLSAHNVFASTYEQSLCRLIVDHKHCHGCNAVGSKQADAASPRPRRCRSGMLQSIVAPQCRLLGGQALL